MKRRIIEAHIAGTLSTIRSEVNEKLTTITRQLEEIIAERSHDLEMIYTLSDTKLSHEIEQLRLGYATPERIQYVIDNAERHSRLAEARYVQFDEDEQSTAEKVSLLIGWGKALAIATTCGYDTAEKSVQFRSEASKLFKQLALKRCGEEKCVSLETWLTAMADILKILARLGTTEQEITLFLSFSLAENIIR